MIVRRSFCKTNFTSAGVSVSTWELHSVQSSVADPHHFDAYPDPNFHFDADPDLDRDTTFHSDADPDPTFQFDADPDPTTHFSHIRIL